MDRRMVPKQWLAEKVVKRGITWLEKTEERDGAPPEGKPRRRRFLANFRRRAGKLAIPYLERFRAWLYPPSTTGEVGVEGFYAPRAGTDDGDASAAPQQRGPPRRNATCCHWTPCRVCHPDPSLVASCTVGGGCWVYDAPPSAPLVGRRPRPRSSLRRRLLTSWLFRPLIMALFAWLDRSRNEKDKQDYWPDHARYKALDKAVREASEKGLLPFPERGLYCTTILVAAYVAGQFCFYTGVWETAGDR